MRKIVIFGVMLLVLGVLDLAVERLFGYSKASMLLLVAYATHKFLDDIDEKVSTK